jgi:L,D-transpeptidase ErfK/SrfK
MMRPRDFPWWKLENPRSRSRNEHDRRRFLCDRGLLRDLCSICVRGIALAIPFIVMCLKLRCFTIAGAILCLGALAAPSAASEPARGMTGGVTSYITSPGDTLGSIGARLGVEVATLASENGLKPTAKLPVGLTLRVDNRHLIPAATEPGVIVLNLPQRMLFYDDETVVRGIPVAVGQPGWQTPTRPFTVLTKETDPTWEVPVSIQAEARRAARTLPTVVPPGPNNPLGKFWLGLSIPSVGIHGTNAPSSIYRAATHGCIRVGAEDIAWLFSRVSVGTRGQIVYEPILLAVIDDEILLEVHRDVYRRLHGDSELLVRALADAAGVSGDVDWDQAVRVIGAHDGVARRVGMRR